MAIKSRLRSGELVKYVDVSIANKEDCQKSLGVGLEFDVGNDVLDTQAYEVLTRKMFDTYPNLSVMAITLRQSRSADHNNWSACMRDTEGFRLSRQYAMTDTVDTT